MDERPWVVLICGLPASGKSTFGRTLANSLDASFVDDPTDFDKQILPLLKSDTGNKITVIADPHLCKEQARKAAELRIKAACGVYPQFIFFENNPAKCLANLARRKAKGDNREVENCIKTYSKLYTIPKDGTVIPIND